MFFFCFFYLIVKGFHSVSPSGDPFFAKSVHQVSIRSRIRRSSSVKVKLNTWFWRPVLNTVLPTKYLHTQSTELCLASPKILTPHPPSSLHPASVSSPPTKGGGRTHSPGGEEGNILEDASQT
jgi:hypothetical protein